jgi:hypothetical protein
MPINAAIVATPGHCAARFSDAPTRLAASDFPRDAQGKSASRRASAQARFEAAVS